MAITTYVDFVNNYLVKNGMIGNATNINKAPDQLKIEIDEINTANSAANILVKLKTVDGTGSGLDADLLDGKESTNANTASTIVARDASGNFSAGTISAALSGNATTATTLQTARTISGVSFNGSANINIEDRLGTAIASAATTTVGTAGLGDYMHITGTTTITSLGTAGAAGIRRTLIFDGALTLTHNATSLICPGAANIVTVAGTVIEVVSETTANWRVVSITHPSLSMAELGYLDGVTSAIQTQINTKAPLASPAFTGTPTVNGAAFSGYSGFKNYIINGNFDIWQYKYTGLTYPQTSSGYGSDDRWGNGNIGSTKAHSQVACTDTERALFNASYFSRTVVTSVAGADNYCHKMQNIEDVTRLAGKTVTLSFWAKADSNKNIAVELEQGFGTGGTPSSYVFQFIAKFALTTTWQKKTITFTVPSIVGKTIGTDGVHTTYTGIRMFFDAGSNLNSRTSNLGQQSGTFDIAQVQLEEGSVATPFEQRPVGLELSLCQRYYVAVNEGPRVEGSAVYSNAAVTYSYYYPVRMRVTPTAFNCFWANGFNAVSGGLVVTSSLLHAELLAVNTGNRFYAELHIGQFSAEL